jgi:4,5-dihydroxyphthalate decarboxylase
VSRLKLTLACGAYDRTFGLFDGSVRPAGIDLNMIAMDPGELFRRQARFAEFDVAEFSLATLAILQAQGDDRFVGIPVFPSRRFRHEHVWISRRAGISSPADLKGKRVGVQEYIQTASVWIRGVLSDEFGVRSEDVEWCVGGYNEPDPGYEHRIPLVLAQSGITVTTLPPDQSIDELLVRGELAAAFPAVPRSFREGSPHVTRLFEDFRRVETDYFARTGIFPIMHLVVLKRELYERHPWAAVSLYRAFEQARRLALRRLEFSPGPLTTSLPWLTENLAEAKAALGDDYWSYGLRGNEHVVATLLRYLEEQALVEAAPAVESLFAPETLVGIEGL